PILFCYTHPLPPRLYSLSLHDALPVAALMVTILGACGSASEATPTPPAPGEVVWPAPDHPLALTVKAGLKPEPKESLTFHVHAHLDVLVDGRPVLVPAGIGVNITDP